MKIFIRPRRWFLNLFGANFKFMCGIVGYIGKKNTATILLDGLSRLEYRGYDSAGIAINDGRDIHCLKVKGKVADLVELNQQHPCSGFSGIAHTRWATHGQPSERNAHPHFDCKKNIYIVHNGIIENYPALKKLLEDEGHVFSSETDSEVIAHLIEKYRNEYDFVESVKIALPQLHGAFSLLLIDKSCPDLMIVAKNGSPLVIGVGEGEHIIASDPSAIVSTTKNVIYLNDQEMALIGLDRLEIFNWVKGKGVNKKIEEINWTIEQIEKGGFETFMIKEIFEQPESVTDALRGRIILPDGQVKISGLDQIKERLKEINRIIIVSCGTSWHAGLVGEFMIEELAKIPVEVEYASEFRYRNPVVGPNCLVVVISQSGETADTLAALRLANEAGALTFGLCNTVGSTIAREVCVGAYLHAGPEIGVASTKAFTTQLALLALLAVYLGTARGLKAETAAAILKELSLVPEKIKATLELNKEIEKIAERYFTVNNALYLGRGYNYPIALEGALKMKEISYIHAEGYPAAEMKHGPIALIDQNMPVIFLATQDKAYEKIMSNIMEVRARQGKIIAVATCGDLEIKKYAEEVIYVPETMEMLTPIINVVPLQLLAYHIARMKGCDVDKPRNLAKSVTVE